MSVWQWMMLALIWLTSLLPLMETQAPPSFWKRTKEQLLAAIVPALWSAAIIFLPWGVWLDAFTFPSNDAQRQQTWPVAVVFIFGLLISEFIVVSIVFWGRGAWIDLPQLLQRRAKSENQRLS